MRDAGSPDLNDDLATARRIVLAGLGAQRARVFLFGSRARGNARPTSDIDIALIADEPLAADTLANIREALEESSIPYVVDVVDLSTVDETFRHHALTGAVQWND